MASRDIQAGDDAEVPGTSILGIIPHQLRGRLAQFGNTIITGAAFDRCSGCSEIVGEMHFATAISLIGMLGLGAV